MDSTANGYLGILEKLGLFSEKLNKKFLGWTSDEGSDMKKLYKLV